MKYFTVAAALLAFTPHLAKSGVVASQIRRHEIGHCNGWPQSHPAE
jgi:hypothetical protein